MSIGDEKKLRFATGVLRGFLKIRKTAELLAALILFTVSVMPAAAQARVTLAWNPIANPLVAGYNIYYGRTSGVYTSKISAGVSTNMTVTNLIVGATYYFATTTYSAGGAESAKSGEVSCLVPAPAPAVQLQVNPARQFVLTVTGSTNHLYTISASQDLASWTVIGTVNAGAGGSANFTDTNAASFPQRFYRVN